MATYLDAAHAILGKAGEPLHYREITERALAQNLIQPSGLTPEATMGSRLYTDTKLEDSRFVRTDRGMFGLARWQPGGIEEQVQQINGQTKKKLLQLLHSMSPERFELLVLELLLAMGFDESTLEITPYSGDGGIDVEGVYRAAGLAEVNVAVQVKRWKRNVQVRTIRHLRGSLEVHQQGIIITTSDYSRGARKEASAQNKTHIGLINGYELVELLIKHKVGVLEKSLKVVSLDDEWWDELLDQPDAEQEITSPAAVEGTASTGQKREGTKPRSMGLLGQVYLVNSWRSVLIVACNVLAQRHGAEFAAKAPTLRGRKRQYIAPSPEGMINPAPIPGTDLWVETNQSARSVMQLLERLLELFGHQGDAIDIETL